MIHPDTSVVEVDAIKGLGVRATTSIPRGTVLWVRDAVDVVLSPEQVDALDGALAEHVDRLGYQDHLGRTIVCWDGGKYVNHSCAPTMRGVGPDAMIAVVDVAAGDEITCDYAECNLDEPFRCACGAAECRGLVGASVASEEWSRWQTDVEAAVRLGAHVAQPLAKLCVDAGLVRVLDGSSKVPPIAAVALSRSDAGP